MIVKKILLSLLAVTLFAASSARCLAKEDNATDAGNKPVAVLSIAGYDRLMSDIDFIGGLADNPDLGKNLEGMIKLFTQGQGLAGLDRKRPLGLTVTTDGTADLVSSTRQVLGELTWSFGQAAPGGEGRVFVVDGRQLLVPYSEAQLAIALMLGQGNDLVVMCRR